MGVGSFFVNILFVRYGLKRDPYKYTHNFYSLIIFCATSPPLTKAASTVPGALPSYKPSPAKNIVCSTGVFKIFLHLLFEEYRNCILPMQIGL